MSEAHAPFELENAGVGHRAVGWRKALAWLLTSAGTLGYVLLGPEGDYGWAVAAGSIGVVMLSWYYAATWSNLWSPPEMDSIGKVRVDDKTLSIEGRKRFSIPLAKIDTRTSWQDRRGFITHFKAKNGDAITVVHERPDAAQALLQAAGERVLLDKMRLSSWVQRGSGREIVVGLGLFAITTVVPVFAIGAAAAVTITGSSTAAYAALGAFISLLLVGLVYGTDKAIAEPMITAGAEGLHLRGAVTRRFIRYKDLEAAALDRHGIRLHFRGGKEELLAMWRHGMWDLPATADEDRLAREGPLATELLHKRARILERIQAGIAAKGSSPMGDLQLALLDRKGRNLDEWRTAMEALLARAEGGYREVRLDADALARVAENPAQPADRRIGAALALRRVADEDVQQRLRFAVETCADEKLRVSLDRATRGEVVEAELSELEAEASAQSARGAAVMRR